MRAAGCFAVASILVLLGGCDRPTAADKVQAHYDNRAAAIDQQADNQSTDMARQIYKDQADAVRQEGEDRAKGLRKAGVDDPPPMPANMDK